jgi:apolipoprotein N-acyltransferase
VFDGGDGGETTEAVVAVIEFLRGLRSWRRAGLALIAGIAAALSMPPLDLWPLLFVTFPAVLFMLEGIERKLRLQSFFLGWCFGFGYFIVTLHWIGFAFFVDAEAYLWMMPFAVGGLAAAMAVYWGLASLCVALSGRKGLPAALVFAVALVTFEYLRGILFTGFPWAAPGLASDGMGAVAQTASLWGMPTLTLLVVLWAVTWRFVLDVHSTRLHRVIALLIIATLPLCWAWGSYRLQHGAVANADGVTIRIVQPNISQDIKWRDENVQAIFAQLLEMSARAAPEGTPTHIIWPETAVSFLIDESAVAKVELAKLLGGTKTLVTGTLRRDINTSGDDKENKVYNSILTFDGSGNVVARYDKWRLVPGGEFLPFEWLLEPLGFRKVVKVPGSFAAGPGPVSLAIPGAPHAGFGVCYEAIFPDHFVDPQKRPGWLINVTNDGWFGNSTGPYQHLAQARLRTIEQGLPMVRAANTGISAVIDPYGRIISSLPLSESGILDTGLPQSLPPTFFADYGELIFFSALLLLLVLSFILQGYKPGYV